MELAYLLLTNDGNYFNIANKIFTLHIPTM